MHLLLNAASRRPARFFPADHVEGHDCALVATKSSKGHKKVRKSDGIHNRHRSRSDSSSSSEGEEPVDEALPECWKFSRRSTHKLMRQLPPGKKSDIGSWRTSDLARRLRNRAKQQQAIEAARQRASAHAAEMMQLDPVSEEQFRRERERAQKERRPVKKLDLELANAKRPGPNWGGTNQRRRSRSDAYEERDSKLFELSCRMKVPADILRSGWDLFEQFALLPGEEEVDVVRRSVDGFSEQLMNEGMITQERFAKTLCELTNSKSVEDLPEGLLWSCFSIADADGSKVLDFREFATWYSRYGFSQSLMSISEEQLEIRACARKYGMRLCDLERFRLLFAQYDDDGSGEISFEEFRKLLATLLKIPAHLEIPEGRLKQFWSETDADGSGSVAFGEFLEFYMKYFAMESVTGASFCPLKEFYRSARPYLMRADTVPEKTSKQRSRSKPH
eukprot:TRINITY_DN19892_c0_g1_i1.p1 TRINITY_DN19892_c0_g1~~TRINITY_DN19892_c0_g1_i1.p1  ORF type:complete len:448 (-),score=94.67 TRINITY_DN19892_c0_g1_i1:372-1715(-)